MKVIDRAYAGYEASVAWARRHSAVFDHFWRALDRYNEVLGGRLAAAISYYGFFAAFSLGLLAYAILGYVLSTQNAFVTQVNDFLASNLPWINASALANQRGALTLIGLVSLVLTGIGWVEALRSSQRAVWQLEQHPGNMIIRRLVDLVILAALGLLLLLSLWLSWAVERLLTWAIGPDYGRIGGGVLHWSTLALEFGVNIVLAAAILAGVPRLKMSPRRLIPTAILLGVGIQVLNELVRLVVGRAEHNPAYALVTGAVGLLLYLYFLNQLIVFASAVAATSQHGRAVDLAGNPPDAPASIQAPDTP
ncbi:hypothetical protein GCM10009682_46800 [Luedemannella flava]|uniref:YihY/virulence factor BrkB family protein n=1 Tax=Luedemannella flava TaxID=349316 RepID=A0ABP4YRA5_9ACTN